MRETPSADGIGGKGEARRTIATADWSRSAEPLERASEAEITLPFAVSEKRTTAKPRMPALLAPAG